MSEDTVARLNAALKGRYRVERELGEGGMATVFLADDLKHDRKVAIKVLHPELSAVIGAERFLAEIRTTANLQHPHILPLFDSGTADGLLFYVMPYVDGESLRDRLVREKQLPVKEAVGIADDVGSALDYAHRQGIVHRDIKPANILLHDGQPLVADFGIALALSTAGSSGRLTETGLSLGTPVYMAPEQASGEGTIDPRSDIYALGCVLYEMLVGDPPFQASTPQGILAKVLTSTPARAKASRSSVPLHVDAVVARSMERIPADRFESVAEMRRALDDPAFRHGGEADARTESRASTPVRGAFAALAVLVVVLGIAAWMGWSRSGARDAPYRVFTLDSPPGGLDLTRGVAVSPDGRLIATVDSASNLQVRTLDGSEPPRVPEVTRVASLKFSPDGSRLGFAIDGVSVTGWAVMGWIPTEGAGRATIAGELRGGRWIWGPEGEIWIESEDGVRILDSEGAPGERLPQPEGQWGRVLETLPDGRVLAVLAPSEDDRPLGIWDPETGNVQVPRSQSGLLGLADARFMNGYLFWENRDRVLSASPFDLEAGVTGPRVVLQDSVSVAPPQWDQFAILPDGTLAVGTGLAPPTVWNLGWMDTEGEVEIIHEPWAEEFASIGRVALSPDGRRAVAGIRPRSAAIREDQSQIWLLDLDARTGRPLVRDGSSWFDWLGNGKVALSRNRDGLPTAIVAVPVDGEGPEEVLAEAPPGQYIHDFSILPDSSGVLYTVHVGDHDDILHASFEDGVAPRPWLATPLNEDFPIVSPDGRWVAYWSAETGLGETYVRSFPDAGPQTRISTGGTGSHFWDPDGRTLYYQSESSGMLRSVRLAFDGNRARVVESGELFSSESFRPDASPIDPATGRFLFVVGDLQRPDFRIRVHLNVFEEIERRIAAEGR